MRCCNVLQLARHALLCSCLTQSARLPGGLKLLDEALPCSCRRSCTTSQACASALPPRYSGYRKSFCENSKTVTTATSSRVQEAQRVCQVPRSAADGLLPYDFCTGLNPLDASCVLPDACTNMRHALATPNGASALSVLLMVVYQSDCPAVSHSVLSHWRSTTGADHRQLRLH